MTDSQLAGRHALVTGGGSGIGAAVATTLAKAGARITLVGRNREKLLRHADTLRGHTEAHIAPADIGDETAVAVAFASAAEALGPVSIKTTLALWRQILDVNLTGTFLCSRAAVPGMVETGWGRLVNVASTAGLDGYAYLTAYCAAKHGVVGFTKALAAELAERGVTVNAVCPGYTETDMVQQALNNIVTRTDRTLEEARAELEAQNPGGRFLSPEEVAEKVLWLCLPASGGITGRTITFSSDEEPE
jgi:NAD(P)-dependent dehydrogenase (short-subunit alcohol dehydrogenase family)